MGGRCFCSGPVSSAPPRLCCDLADDRIVDAYRAKMRSSMISAGKRVSEIPPHFELRPGKMRWEARAKRAKRPDGE